MQEFLTMLVTILLVDPILNEIAEALAAARAPQEIVSALMTCAADQGPQIINRALDDPFWAISSIVGAWIGFAEPTTLLAEAAPNCAAAIHAAQPFFDAKEGVSG